MLDILIMKLPVYLFLFEMGFL